MSKSGDEIDRCIRLLRALEKLHPSAPDVIIALAARAKPKQPAPE